VSRLKYLPYLKIKGRSCHTSFHIGFMGRSSPARHRDDICIDKSW
jgi:hypothetical protein